ncbi:hypothetical protein CRG98_036467 [Punica granatum]|uniref:Uncharacterized protein n=1 Tax=Punica granatum TaxID=22663 RepID=A0A2I0IGM7_PUNGR|nr:hypothetical protein CRG98_036467 [Punica granatum]
MNNACHAWCWTWPHGFCSLEKYRFDEDRCLCSTTSAYTPLAIISWYRLKDSSRWILSWFLNFLMKESVSWSMSSSGSFTGPPPRRRRSHLGFPTSPSFTNLSPAYARRNLAFPFHTRRHLVAAQNCTSSSFNRHFGSKSRSRVLM